MHCIPLTFLQCFMLIDMYLYFENCVLIDLDWVELMMQFFLHVTCSCSLFMHMYHFFSIYLFWVVIVFCFFSLSRIDCAWHPSANLLWLGTLFVLGYLLPPILPFSLFTFGSMMRRPIKTSRRTFLNVAFIQSTMWFYQTFLILLFPMSLTLGDGDLFVRY